jgi:hypothetical protein
MNSPLRTTPYHNKNMPDYHSLRLSKSRARKIAHVQRMVKAEVPKSRILHHAINNMNMPGNDIVAAYEGLK